VKLVLYPAFLVILLVTGNIGGMETTGKIGKIDVTKRVYFTAIIPLDVY
jgi:hypothetical protein